MSDTTHGVIKMFYEDGSIMAQASVKARLAGHFIEIEVSDTVAISSGTYQGSTIELLGDCGPISKEHVGASQLNISFPFTSITNGAWITIDHMMIDVSAQLAMIEKEALEAAVPHALPCDAKEGDDRQIVTSGARRL